MSTTLDWSPQAGSLLPGDLLAGLAEVRFDRPLLVTGIQALPGRSDLVLLALSDGTIHQHPASDRVDLLPPF